MSNNNNNPTLVEAMVSRGIQDAALELLKAATDDYASRIWDKIKDDVTGPMLDELNRESKHGFAVTETTVAEAIGAALRKCLNLRDWSQPVVIPTDEDTAEDLSRIKDVAAKADALVTALVGLRHRKPILKEILPDVLRDVNEAADRDFTDGDVRLAVGRAVASRLEIEV